MSMNNFYLDNSPNSSMAREPRNLQTSSTSTPKNFMRQSSSRQEPYFISIDEFTNLKNTLESNNDRIAFLEQERACYIDYIENVSKLNSRFLYTSIITPIAILGIMLSFMFFLVDNPYIKYILAGVPSIGLAFIGFKLGMSVPHDIKKLTENNNDMQKTIVQIKTKLQMR